MLIASPRHTEIDLLHWSTLASYDARRWSARHERLVERSAKCIQAFATAPCYLGVSWGKDSVVVADLVMRHAPHVPIVWMRWEPMANPDCAAVRDVFLARHPGAAYHEIVTRWVPADNAVGWANPDDARDLGFRSAELRFGSRYISGVRADESRTRRMRCARWGETSPNTCAPLARWSALDVFAYLARHDLPIHPAYAMTFGGSLEREQIRVDCIGGVTGAGRGRQEWERAYYGPELRALGGAA